MFYRYDLDVFHSDVSIYHGSFYSINHLVKFACGFDRDICDITAFDSLFEKYLPLDAMCDEMEVVNNGI